MKRQFKKRNVNSLKLKEEIDRINSKIDEILKIQTINYPQGFFTLSKSQGELWDNENDDEWDKCL